MNLDLANFSFGQALITQIIILAALTSKIDNHPSRRGKISQVARSHLHKQAITMVRSERHNNPSLL